MEQIEEKEIRPYDVIVIGAGAAGMMAAGTAAQACAADRKDGQVGP
jgi:succinate dehydrogenase/fumarate reductase flavoprotein subunit